MSLEGKVALITGGTGALGHAVTAAFAEAGARLAVPYHDEVEAESSHKLLGARADTVTFLKADVTAEAEVQRLVSTLVDRFGRIDILLNLVGGS